MWPYYSCIHSKVSWRARIWLDIDTPLCRVKFVSLQCPLLTEYFNLINVFIATIISADTEKSHSAFGINLHSLLFRTGMHK